MFLYNLITEVFAVKAELIKMIEQIENDKIIRRIFHLVKNITKKSSSSA